MNYFIYIIAFISFLEAQQEILLDRVASVVENKIVLMSDVVLAANAVAAQQQINPNTNPTEYKKILETSRESMVEQLLIIEMAEQDSVEILDKDIFLLFFMGLNIIDGLSLLFSLWIQYLLFSNGQRFIKSIINFSTLFVYFGLIIFFTMLIKENQNENYQITT